MDKEEFPLTTWIRFVVVTEFGTSLTELTTFNGVVVIFHSINTNNAVCLDARFKKNRQQHAVKKHTTLKCLFAVKILVRIFFLLSKPTLHLTEFALLLIMVYQWPHLHYKRVVRKQLKFENVDKYK